MAIAKSDTFTLTFGDAGENHVGMEMVGKLGDVGSGYSVDELVLMTLYFEALGYNAEMTMFDCENEDGKLIKDAEPAAVMIVKGFINKAKQMMMYEELSKLDWDKKYWDVRRGKVLNKIARTNLVFLNGFSQEPDYENKKGRIVDIKSVKEFSELHEIIRVSLNEATDTVKANGLICEGNHYYDSRKCGIGWHGDSERRKVIAVRIGKDMKMCWQWFNKSKPVGKKYEFVINSGDLYVMSEKAVGHDWKMSSLYTLRHSAGCDKYTKLG